MRMLTLCVVLVVTPPAVSAQAPQISRDRGAVIEATGTFDVRLLPQPTDAAPLGRMSIDKTFHGDLSGTSQGEMLAFRSAVEGSAGYVAMELVTGTLHGKSGTFVLQHSGTMERGAQHLVLTVVPDSGTDGLVGLAGSMRIIIEDDKHTYVFDYTLR